MSKSRERALHEMARKILDGLKEINATLQATSDEAERKERVRTDRRLTRIEERQNRIEARFMELELSRREVARPTTTTTSHSEPFLEDFLRNGLRTSRARGTFVRRALTPAELKRWAETGEWPDGSGC